MTKNVTQLRVLIVDDNRDGADALGLVVEALGHQVHVTYGGSQALDVATAFQPAVMLIDLAMPEMDGCSLAIRFRQSPTFASTNIVAITGLADEVHRSQATHAGFDFFLPKPVSLKHIEGVLSGVKVVAPRHAPKTLQDREVRGTPSRLSIAEARRIRTQRKSKSLTKAECQAAICDGIIGFQAEYMGLQSEVISADFIDDLLVVRILGTLTFAERQLGRVQPPENGRDLIKKTRKQLVELARPMLESLIHEVSGIKVRSMHHDISTVTGEEILVFSLVAWPRFS